MALEPMPTFGKGLDLRRAAEEAFEVKDVLNSTLDSETLKQTLYRQAKNQVGTQQSHPTPTAFPRSDSGQQLPWPGTASPLHSGHPMPAWGTPRAQWPPPHAHCIS